MTKISFTTESLEDYLEIIFSLIEEKRVARVRDIAQRKGVNMASVTDALRRLDRDGLVRYTAREFVEFTEQGSELARKVVQRHEFLVRFLRDVLLLDPSTAERDACSIEHHITNETFARLAMFFQFVITQPDADRNFIENFRKLCNLGDKDASSECARCLAGQDCASHGSRALRAARFRHGKRNLVPLSRLKPGESGRVLQVLAGKGVCQRLIEMGVLPNVRIEMEGVAPLGDPIRVRIKGYRLSMRGQEAASILVDKENETE
jgi:DtxR family Mn-dependent transcriptional regulator